MGVNSVQSQIPKNLNLTKLHPQLGVSLTGFDFLLPTIHNLQLREFRARSRIFVRYEEKSKPFSSFTVKLHSCRDLSFHAELTVERKPPPLVCEKRNKSNKRQETLRKV